MVEQTYRGARQKNMGFTLIELLIVVAIVSILSAIALPAYQDYVRRSQLQTATSALAAFQAQMEQYYQDNRTYANGAACGRGIVNTNLFTYVCATAAAGQTYLMTATGVAGTNVANFTYTLTQAPVMTTVVAPALPGWASNGGCWVTKKGGLC